MIQGAVAPYIGSLFPEKIQRRHRERSAIVYIRQSTLQQVERHQESTVTAATTAPTNSVRVRR